MITMIMIAVQLTTALITMSFDLLMTTVILRINVMVMIKAKMSNVRLLTKTILMINMLLMTTTMMMSYVLPRLMC